MTLDERRWGKSSVAVEAPVGISFARLALELLAVTLACSAVLLYVTVVKDAGTDIREPQTRRRLDDNETRASVERDSEAKTRDE